MRLDTQPLLVLAARLALAGYFDSELLARRRTTITVLEGALAAKEEHVTVYETSRAQLRLDGTALAWERWRAEHYLLTLARAEVARTEGVIRMELELLEREVALAQQHQARALATTGARA